MKNKPIIVYLHGFRSSPQSYKAQYIKQHLLTLGVCEQYICPQLPASPAHAISLILSLISDYSADKITLIGSSLGGYYATWIAEKIGCRAILLNPVVRLPEDMTPFISASTTYHSSDEFEFKAEYVAELRNIGISTVTKPHRYLLLAATKDELLDWRDMTAHFPLSRQIIIGGSNHALTGFEKYIDVLMSFSHISHQSRSTRPKITQWREYFPKKRVTKSLSDWLFSTGSLSAHLSASTNHFKVHCVKQCRETCLQDETTPLKLSRKQQMTIRDVVLYGDAKPLVFAHTAVFTPASAANCQKFRKLGNNSLGKLLFSTPNITISKPQFARIHTSHSLAQRIYKVLPVYMSTTTFMARRTRYRRGESVFLITEVFLPEIENLPLRHTS